jgi:glycosyltransferase involved in cell wall biosynthesis
MYQNAPCSGPGMVKCLICSGRHYGFIKGLTTVISSRVMNAAERLTADMFIPVSQAVAIGNGLVNSKLPYRVIPNFLPDNVINSTDDSYLSQLPCRDYLLYVGALEKIKGIDVLLRAYGELNNAPPLVLIGYQTSNFQFQTTRNVIVLKNWPNAAVREAMYRSAFTLIPSIMWEACPTVAMESMAMGRPIIASRIGGLTDLVEEGVTGFLVPPGDSNALRQAIELLLANPNLREQMGRAGKNKVVKFQASTVVPRIEDVYNDLVSKPRNYL